MIFRLNIQQITHLFFFLNQLTIYYYLQNQQSMENINFLQLPHRYYSNQKEHFSDEKSSVNDRVFSIQESFDEQCDEQDNMFPAIMNENEKTQYMNYIERQCNQTKSKIQSIFVNLFQTLNINMPGIQTQKYRSIPPSNHTENFPSSYKHLIQCQRFLKFLTIAQQYADIGWEKQTGQIEDVITKIMRKDEEAEIMKQINDNYEWMIIQKDKEIMLLNTKLKNRQKNQQKIVYPSKNSSLYQSRQEQEGNQEGIGTQTVCILTEDSLSYQKKLSLTPVYNYQLQSCSQQPDRHYNRRFKVMFKVAIESLLGLLKILMQFKPVSQMQKVYEDFKSKITRLSSKFNKDYEKYKHKYNDSFCREYHKNILGLHEEIFELMGKLEISLIL